MNNEKEPISGQEKLRKVKIQEAIHQSNFSTKIAPGSDPVLFLGRKLETKMETKLNTKTLVSAIVSTKPMQYVQLDTFSQNDERIFTTSARQKQKICIKS